MSKGLLNSLLAAALLTTVAADVQVEQPTRFESVINLVAAKQIGVTIPQSVPSRATEGIR